MYVYIYIERERDNKVYSQYSFYSQSLSVLILQAVGIITLNKCAEGEDTKDTTSSSTASGVERGVADRFMGISWEDLITIWNYYELDDG